MSSTVVGIDIGSTSVRAVEVRHADGPKPVVARYHEVPLPPDSVRRGEVLEVSTVSTAIRRLWSTGGFKTKDVVLGMGGPRVLSREFSVPLAPLGQIREALPFQVQDLLPVPVADALLDFYPISQTEGPQGPVVHGLLIAAVKEAVEANIAAVTKAGLRPTQVDLIPFALTRALTPKAAAGGMVALVSIGANTTNVVIVDNGVPQFVRIIASGGDDITQALASRLSLTEIDAEALKREVGLGSPTITVEQRPAVDVVFRVAGEQLTAIRNTINYFVNTRDGAVLNRILVSGGGGLLKGLVGGLGELTGVPVSLAEPLGGASLGGRSAGASAELGDSMTTAYALALGWTA